MSMSNMKIITLAVLFKGREITKIRHPFSAIKPAVFRAVGH